MYSLEDRMKAVQLCINSGCDEVVVPQTLGYPSPNALRQSYKEYEQTGPLHQKEKRKIQYTEEQIEAAVAYYDEHGGSLPGVSRAPGYPDQNTLCLWVRAAHPSKGTVPAKHCKSGR